MKLPSDDLVRVDGQSTASRERIHLTPGAPPAVLTLSDMLKIAEGELAPAESRGRRIRPHKNAE